MARSSIPKTPARGFTTKWLENLKPAYKRFELADNGAAGLRLRVSPGGAKTFVWLYRHNQKTHRHTLGQFGEGAGKLTLSAARKQLQELKGKREAGTLNAPNKSNPKTVKDLVATFHERILLKKRKRPDEALHLLQKELVSTLGNKKIEHITASQLSAIVDGVVDRGATTHAGKVLNLIKQVFGFAEGKGYVERNPAYPLKKNAFEIEDNRRDRALSLDEIKVLWDALAKAPRMSPQFKIGLKILLITGVRSGELRLARWSEIDLDNGHWLIPEENTKGGKAWEVPLTPLAVDQFRELQEFTGESDWVMASPESLADTNKLSKHVDDKALARSVNRLLKLKGEDGELILDIPKFVPHDLRRTLRTHLSKLKIPPHIAEKCLNHSLGRIEETYDVHTYYEERKEALEKWADSVELVINECENVIRMNNRADIC
ncbi:MAG: tyrosine-type recombinase/integrase [Candidatus Sedimenticola sp. (ex Thyasira tokunagai)]